jgi:predicted nucleic acid-binding protein
MAEVVVLDASTVIALYDSKDKNHSWALELFRETISFDLVMPSLTYAEVLVHPIRSRKQKSFEKGIAGLGIRIHGLEASEATCLAQIRAKTNLKMPDAIVLFTALEAKAAIATTDKSLALSARKLSVGVFQPE